MASEIGVQPGATTKYKTHSNNLQELLTEEAPRHATISCFGAESGCKTLSGGEAAEGQLQKHHGCGPVKELKEHSWG